MVLVEVREMVCVDISGLSALELAARRRGSYMRRNAWANFRPLATRVGVAASCAKPDYADHAAGDALGFGSFWYR
jgi:hypothetical protein